MKKMLAWFLILALMLPVCAASAEQATLLYSYGQNAKNKHLLDIQNTVEYAGKTWLFDFGSYDFNGAFTMEGGNTHAVLECNVPAIRMALIGDQKEIYLGTVKIEPPSSMKLYVFSGDRVSGDYTLVDQQETNRYVLDIYATRDEKGRLRVIDKVFLYSYYWDGVEKRYAGSLYISYSDVSTAPADTAPVSAQLVKTGGASLPAGTKESEPQPEQPADNSTAQLLEAERNRLNAELADLQKQYAGLAQQNDQLTQENKALSASIGELEKQVAELQYANAYLKESSSLEKMLEQQTELALLQVENEKLQAESAKVPGLTAQVVQLQAEADRVEALMKQIADLEAELAQMRPASAVQAKDTQIGSAQKKPASQKSTETAGPAQAEQLEALEAENAQLKEQLAELESELKALYQSVEKDKADHAAQLAELEAELEEAYASMEEGETNLGGLTDAELNELLSIVQKERQKREAEKPASPADDFRYASNGSEVQINTYIGSDTHVVIPEAIDGLPVTRIGNSAFNDLERLESVVLPSTLTEIGQFAFAWNDGLSGILEIPPSVKTIGQNAFNSNQFSGIILNSDVKVDYNQALGLPMATFLYIREGANPQFKSGSFGYGSYLEIAIIPASVTSLPDGLFDYCSKVTIVTPAGSAAEAWAKENFIPVNTADYEEYVAEYEAMYPRQW